MNTDVGGHFVAHRARVYRWALLLCRRPEDALDVVQDVFLRMVRRPPDTASIAGTIAWLRRTTQRVAIDRWRAAAAGPAVEVVAGERLAAGRAAAHGAGAGDALERSEQSARVRASLAELSDHQRLVLVSRICDEMTFQQIADELGISVSTAKTHYVRGLMALRARLMDSAQTAEPADEAAGDGRPALPHARSREGMS